MAGVFAGVFDDLSVEILDTLDNFFGVTADSADSAVFAGVFEDFSVEVWDLLDALLGVAADLDGLAGDFAGVFKVLDDFFTVSVEAFDDSKDFLGVFDALTGVLDALSDGPSADAGSAAISASTASSALVSPCSPAAPPLWSADDGGASVLLPSPTASTKNSGAALSSPVWVNTEWTKPLAREIRD